MLSDVQTGAYSTAHTVSEMQPPTLFCFAPHNGALFSALCVCLRCWLWTWEQVLMRCTSTAHSAVVLVPGFVPHSLPLPLYKIMCFNKKWCHTHKMGNMQSGSSSVSHHTVDTTNQDLTCSDSKEMKGLTLVHANGDPIRWLNSFMGSWLLLLLPLTEPSWPVQSNWRVNPGLGRVLSWMRWCWPGFCCIQSTCHPSKGLI